MAEVPALSRHVYLIADDLTGALDTAAQFVSLVGEIDVFWRTVEQDGSIALDSGTREASEAEAAAVSVEVARGARAVGTLKYLKLDSLLASPARYFTVGGSAEFRRSPSRGPLATANCFEESLA